MKPSGLELGRPVEHAPANHQVRPRVEGDIRFQRTFGWLGLGVMLGALLTVSSVCRAEEPSSAPGKPPGARRWPGVTYWRERIAAEPWSIHVVKIDRGQTDLKLVTVLARNTIVGLTTLGNMVRGIPAAWGKPLAAINGDFYVVDHGPFIGDPRGTQIMNGELLSGPSDQLTFWIDSAGQPHAEQVSSKFTLTWPDGTTSPMKLNEQRGTKEVVLFTPRVGGSTRSPGGFEAVLEPAEKSPWLPLQPGKQYTARIAELNNRGETPLTPGRMVLSLGPKVTRANSLAVGAVLKFSTATEPQLTGVETAIGGGNLMIHGGQVQEFNLPANGAYKYRSVVERHPRSAVGFNATHIFLVQVDGRQADLSVGMTLEELGRYMRRLGCEEAMNLDGGGSSTLWVDGRIVNSPCNGDERDISNGLVLVRTPPAAVAAPAAGATK